MRVIEINRIIKTMEADERISGKTAEWLDLLMGIGSSDRASEDENMVECRNNITRLFPDPIDRARFLRRMVVSIANEDPNDYDEDEGEISNEIVFFLNEMLKSFALAIEEAGSMEDCGTIISKCAVDNGGTENG